MLGFRTVLAFFMYVRDVRQARILTMIGCRWPGFGSGSGASGPKQWPISWANVFTLVVQCSSCVVLSARYVL